jgi:hypothetical protein
MQTNIIPSVTKLNIIAMLSVIILSANLLSVLAPFVKFAHDGKGNARFNHDNTASKGLSREH